MALCIHGQERRRNEGYWFVTSVGFMVGSFLLVFLEEQKAPKLRLSGTVHKYYALP